MPAALLRPGPVLCLLLGLLLSGCARTESISPPKAPADSSARRAAAAARTLAALESAVRAGHPTGLEALAARGDDSVRRFVENAHALDVRGLDLRYVDGGLAPLAAGPSRKYGDRAWVAAVATSYRLPMDTAATHMEVAVTFVADGGRARIVSFGGYDDRSALWMRGPVTVLRSPRVTVIDAQGAAGTSDARRYAVLGRRAIRDVHRVLPDWHGHLVLDVPGSGDELDSVLQADPQTYANIAAVTTSVDGSLVPGSPVHVFVNPPVFDTLKETGAQVVVSHESTHVATGATFASMPTWLLEGFADYVALDHAGVPVRVAASQILARVRKHGLPGHLPDARELDPTANGLGATYEEAWLACRFLARSFGEDGLVSFYTDVSRGTDVGMAFRALGTTEASFVAAWRDRLAELAERAGAGAA